MFQSSNEGHDTKMKEKNLHRRSFPICPKCGQTCSKQESISFVRAFNQVYHYHCFTCEDCKIPVANNFFTLEDKQRLRNKKIILCETHYLTRTRNNTQCPSCTTPTPSSYRYEFKGTSYCRLHYSLIDQTHCAGCDQAILKNYVEHQNYPNKIWHPECYMIYKFWSIKLAPKIPLSFTTEQELIHYQNIIHQKVKRVWSDLSSFEESSANCISDMLLHVAAGAYVESIQMANQFIMHLDVLFSALSNLNQGTPFDQANSICNDMIRFFELLTLSKSNSTQELISLVTNLAKNLKYLIRAALALALEQDEDALSTFLNQLSELDKRRVWISGRYWFKDPPPTTVETLDICYTCQQPIRKSDCYQSSPYKWHSGTCFKCTQCATQLTLDNAIFTPTAILYCTTCHPNETKNSKLITFSYSYEQNLHHLKCYLSKISAHLSKEKNIPLLPDSKRQHSLLRKLVHRQDTIPIKQGQMATKKRTTNLTISTNTPSTSLNMAMTESPVSSSSAVAATTSPLLNKLSQTMKRSFSSRRRKSTLYYNNLFGKARRASILTMDEYGQTSHKYAQMTNFTLSQNFILRHAAVIALYPLMSDEFTLDELIALIEESHSPASPSVLWGRLVSHIRSTSTTFGASLPVVAQRDHEWLVQRQKESTGVTLRDDTPTFTACFSENAFIPIFIKACIAVILQSDMSVEGVFRKNGNIRQLNTTSEAINHLKPVTMQAVETMLQPQNSIQLAALLKRYLRELPEPLFPFAFHRLFLECSKEVDTMKRRKLLHLACCLLPKPNRDTMYMIFCCLKWVASFSEKNKMDVQNLARVIAPSVLFDKCAPNTMLAQEEINVVETLVQDINEISIVPVDLVLLKLNGPPQDFKDLDSKYFITEYQKLLDKINSSTTTTTTTTKEDDVGIPKHTTTAFTLNQKKTSSWMLGLKK